MLVQFLLVKFGSMIGASVSKFWRPDVTHVIAATDAKGACTRTLKVLMAIVNGSWVLKIDCKLAPALSISTCYCCSDYFFIFHLYLCQYLLWYNRYLEIIGKCICYFYFFLENEYVFIFSQAIQCNSLEQSLHRTECCHQWYWSSKAFAWFGCL